MERKIDGAKGKIVQRRENSWFLSYSTKPTYFSIENTGLTFIFNVSGFDADQQEVSKDEFVDLGTRMSGRFYYFVPTVFYEWGSFESGIYARAGAGLGAGIARFNGDIILTSTASDEIISLQQSRTRITPATSFMLEANWYHWGVTLQFAGPNYQTDDYDITVEDASISLGYRLVF